MEMTSAYTVYFGGALFTHKDLLGNALLASAIEEHAAHRYVCVLPQHVDQTTVAAVDIRNQDLLQVMTCDLALFNFDGTDLDAGTVVEFMFAKFLDIPVVLLRTDFRAAGDQPGAGDAWNLMCSFYPRTKVVQLHAMAWYQQARHAGGTLHEVAQRLCQRLAIVVIENLDAVRREPPVTQGSQAEVERLYHWALRFPGSGFETYGAAPAFVTQLVAAKGKKGLL
jgi:nucleoside 2-deoxyribosyltransferase